MYMVTVKANDDGTYTRTMQMVTVIGHRHEIELGTLTGTARFDYAENGMTPLRPTRRMGRLPRLGR